MIRPPPRSTLFPYTRSSDLPAQGRRKEGSHLSRAASPGRNRRFQRSEEHTSELQSQFHPVCRLLLEKKKTQPRCRPTPTPPPPSRPHRSPVRATDTPRSHAA